MRHVLLVALIVAGCVNARTNGAQDGALPAAVAADTVLGRVAEVGADPATWIALQPESGGAALRLEGALTGLRSVTGAQVLVSGTRTDGVLTVASFVVRRVNDQPVDDGLVSVDGDRVMLRMSGTTREVPNAPPQLRALAGSRVWVTLPQLGVSPSFGVIAQ